MHRYRRNAMYEFSQYDSMKIKFNYLLHLVHLQIQTDIALSDVYDSVINIVAADLPTSVYVYKFNFEGSIGTMKERVLEVVDEPLEGKLIHWHMFSIEYLKIY